MKNVLAVVAAILLPGGLPLLLLAIWHRRHSSRSAATVALASQS